MGATAASRLSISPKCSMKASVAESAPVTSLNALPTSPPPGAEGASGLWRRPRGGETGVVGHAPGDPLVLLRRDDRQRRPDLDRGPDPREELISRALRPADCERRAALGAELQRDGPALGGGRQRGAG